MRIVIITALGFFIATGCAQTHTENLDTTDWDVVEDVSLPDDKVLIELRPGHMTASGYFIEKSHKVDVPPNGAWGYTQIAAKLDVPDHLNPDLLRVIFSSDRVEWVATALTGETYVFLSEEECLETGLQCDDVVPGASESGYFETGGPFEERLAITNVHCSPYELPYDLNIAAFVIDISYPLAEIVSEETYLAVNCLAQEAE